MKNEKLEEKYNEWHNEFESLRKKILLASRYDFRFRLFNGTKRLFRVTYKMAKIEMEIYKTKTKANLILNEIKAIILNEEKITISLLNIKLFSVN